MPLASQSTLLFAAVATVTATALVVALGLHRLEAEWGHDADSNGHQPSALPGSEVIHILIFVATPTAALKRSLRVFLDSLHQHHSPQTIHLHLACDSLGCAHCSQDGLIDLFNTTLHPLEAMVNASGAMLGTLDTFFTFSPESHYANRLFVLSLVLHSLLPHLPHLLLLDADLTVTAPLNTLWNKLQDFSPEQGFGMSYEQQPVYRHVLDAFRRQHPNTTLGNPPATGFPGFNSGVLLLHLDHLRHSATYAAVFTTSTMHDLAQRYQFRGHLGDQDFYTLLYIVHPGLFEVLPCGHNRQLCTWWQRHPVYAAVFDEYHQCNESVLIWHANCNSQSPV
jgi:lipopolysaccharide biosynthesis glycosyltransferase